MRWPEILYRYSGISDNLLRGLRNNETWFSSSDSFNDIFDCRFNLQNEISAEQLSRVPSLVAQWPATLCKFVETSNGESILQFEDASIGELSRKFQSKLTEKISANLSPALQSFISGMGIHCLSEVSDSLLLWSHYADQHRGVCLHVTLDVQVMYEKQIGAEKVRYTTHYPQLSVTDFAALPERVRETILLTKSVEWSYEREWRLTHVTGANSLRKSPYRIMAVTFGSRVTRQKMRDVVEAIESGGTVNFEIFVAEPSEDHFALNRRCISRDQIYQTPAIAKDLRQLDLSRKEHGSSSPPMSLNDLKFKETIADARRKQSEICVELGVDETDLHYRIAKSLLSCGEVESHLTQEVGKLAFRNLLLSIAVLFPSLYFVCELITASSWARFFVVPIGSLTLAFFIESLLFNRMRSGVLSVLISILNQIRNQEFGDPTLASTPRDTITAPTNQV